MQDRIPGSPGRHKAKISLDQLDALQKGEEFSITLTRDDEPVIDGTPYSKAAVLPDALAAQLCPDMEDPAPKDAFQALADRMLESQEHPGCYYRMVVGEKEWLNPPMVTGEEYRTTERCEGEPIYVKKIDIGNLPDGTQEAPAHKAVGHGLPRSVTFVSVEVAARDTGSLFQPFPFFNNKCEIRAKIHVNYQEVHVYSVAALNNYTAMATLRYTK